MSRNQKILLGLLVILALALAYRLTNPFEQETVDRLTYARATKVIPAKTAAESRAEVRIDLLQSPPRSDVAIQRDVFRPPDAGRSKAKDDIQPPAAEPQAPPKTERQKIQEHFRQFKAFGSYRKGDDITIFLERGKQVLVVTRGDRIDGKYQVTDLAEKSITISAEGVSSPLQINFDELP